MKKSKAFTLIELLVVISIIALLISILLPALSSARKAALTSMCLSRMRQVMVTNYTYQGDYNGYNTPLSRDTATNNYWGSHKGKYRWQNYMEVYSSNYSIFNCPQREIFFPGHSVLNEATEHPDFPGWIIDRGKSWDGNARANMAWSNFVGGQADEWGARNEDVENILLDKNLGGLNTAIAVADGTFWTTNSGNVNGTGDSNIFEPSRYVHLDRINLGFMDGHAGTKNKDDISENKWPKNFYITAKIP